MGTVKFVVILPCFIDVPLMAKTSPGNTHPFQGLHVPAPGNLWKKYCYISAQVRLLGFSYIKFKSFSFENINNRVMKYIVSFFLFLGVLSCSGQNISVSLESAMRTMQSDPQFAHSIISLFVMESTSGKIVFEKNVQTGMAPASVQKVITSVTAFELLGKDFRYKTFINQGRRGEGRGKTAIIFAGSGDPTLGSWRWKETSEETVLQRISNIIAKSNIESPEMYIDDELFSYQPIPDGWIWQDMGNYYGAGAWGFNWRENQFDLHLRSGETLDRRTEIASTVPGFLKNDITNLVTSAKKGSGDNVYIYSAPYNKEIFATGTVPVGEKDFVVSGSLPNPPETFGRMLTDYLKQITLPVVYSSLEKKRNYEIMFQTRLDSILSPSFDSMNYWFLKKSINLYGEAFVKTIASQHADAGQAGTNRGIPIIQQFWKERGIDPGSLKMMDGSGLSPSNRVTTAALVKVLGFAKGRPWFNSFYTALPEINGIKMKDGYIGGVRSYAGYVKSKSGSEYTFAFIVNNFDGSPGAVREKMWRVLDLLK